MSSDAPREVLLCDKCSQSLHKGELSQCAICDGIYHRECYRLHAHPEHTLEKRPLHEWRGP
jgi:hypothetical protein